MNVDSARVLNSAEPAIGPLSEEGRVCCRGHIALCRRSHDAWICDPCAVAGHTPQSAQAERLARARAIPPAKVALAPVKPKRERARFKRRGKEPVFFNAADAQEYERWRLAHPLEAVERKPKRIPGEREQPVADECGMFEVYDD